MRFLVVVLMCWTRLAAADAVEPIRAAVREGNVEKAVALAANTATITPEDGDPTTSDTAKVTLCVGKDPSNDLVLSDPQASRRHVVLTITPDGVLAHKVKQTREADHDVQAEREENVENREIGDAHPGGSHGR